MCAVFFSSHFVLFDMIQFDLKKSFTYTIVHMFVFLREEEKEVEQ